MIDTLRRSALALLLAGLTACSFHLRGATPLPFDSIYIGIPDNTQFGAEIRRSLRAVSPNTQQVADPKDAQVRLQNLVITRENRELSLNPQGHVEEYELTLSLRYLLIDRDGRVLVPETVLTASRDLPYDAQIVQAKQSEMETLYQNMESSMVDRIIRHLTSAEVRQAVVSAEAARANESVDAPPLIAPDDNPADALPAEWQSHPSDFEAPGQRGF